MQLSNAEINHIKTSKRRCSIQGLADEIGVDKTTIAKKLNEIEMKNSLRRMVL
ncbi:MAG: hypothetical protein ABEK17_04780 [Candidatus Aenigmatarchaeota archaeon]